MSAPVIQPSNPSGGAPLAPGAGSAGANTTINPAETRVQQEAAAAQAAQQASAAYAKREKQIDDAAEERKKRVDESELRGWGARAEGAVDAPDREMIERGTTQIRSLNANTRGKTNLGDLARAEESKKFAAWDVAEQKRAYEEELSLEEAKWNYAAFMMAQREGAAQAERLAATRAQNEYIENKHKLMVDMGFKTFDELDQAVQDFKEYQASQPLFGPAPPKTIDISGMDVNAKHALMVDLGLKTFDELDTAIKTYNDTAIKAYNAGYNSPAEMQAAEKAAWTAYQNQAAAEQTNPVLRDYAAAAEQQAKYNLLGQPTGLTKAPNLTNAEKYNVINEFRPGEYLYNPLSDKITKKQVVDTSEYVTTELLKNQYVQDLINTTNKFNEERYLQAEKEGAGVGDTSGKRFIYAFSEPLITAPQTFADALIGLEHIVRNPSELLNIPQNIAPAFYDLSKEAESDPHRVAGILVGSTVMGTLGGSGLAKGISSLAGGIKKVGLHADLAKAGGNINTAKAIETIGAEAPKIPPEIRVEPRLNEVRNIGSNADTVLNAIRDQDITLYGTGVNVGQKITPPRSTSDIDLYIHPEDTGIIQNLAQNLGEKYEINGLTITYRFDPNQRAAHAIDTHLYPANYPAKYPVITDKSSLPYSESVYYPFKVTPDSYHDIVTAGGVRMESDARQSARKAAGSLYHEEKGKILPGPAEHRYKDVWDLIADTQYKIDVERGRTYNPFRIYRTNKLEKSLKTIINDPKYQQFVASAEEKFLDNGQITHPTLTSWENPLSWTRSSDPSRLSAWNINRKLRSQYAKTGGDVNTYDAIVDIAKRSNTIEPETISPLDFRGIKNIGDNADVFENAIRKANSVVYGQGSLSTQMKKLYRITDDIDALATDRGIRIIKTANKDAGSPYTVEKWTFNKLIDGEPDAALDIHPYSDYYPGIRPEGKRDPYPRKPLPFADFPTKGEILVIDGIPVEKISVGIRRKAAASLYHNEYTNPLKYFPIEKKVAAAAKKEEKEITFRPGPTEKRGGKDILDLVAIANYQAGVEQARIPTYSTLKQLRAQRNVNSIIRDINQILSDPMYGKLAREAESKYLANGQMKESVLNNLNKPVSLRQAIKSAAQTKDEGMLVIRAPGIKRTEGEKPSNPAQNKPKTTKSIDSISITFSGSKIPITINTRSVRTYTTPVTKKQSNAIKKATTAAMIQYPSGQTLRKSTLYTPPYCLLYTPQSPRDKRQSRIPSSAF